MAPDARSISRCSVAPCFLKARAVFFDFGGTLLVMRRDRIISSILAEEGYPASLAQVHSAYSGTEPAWLLTHGDRIMTGEEAEEAYRQLEAAVFRFLFPGKPAEEVGRVSALMRGKWNAAGGSVPLELYPDVIPTLERLRADGYTLGLVSNAPPDTIKSIEKLRLPDYLPIIVVSGIVGVSKPNPEIFRIALRRAGAQPEESVHVGDIYEADVIGPRRAGMTGILIDRSGERPKLDCPTIATLGGVYDFLE